MGWVDGSVNKILAIEAREPKFGLSVAIFKKKKKYTFLILVFRKAETVVFLDLNVQAA